jgi:hypothetical protein
MAFAVLVTATACSAFDSTTLPPGTYGSDASAMSGSSVMPFPTRSREGRDYYEETPSWWPG